METYFETEVHIALTSNGLKKFWKGYTITDGENHFSQSESWQLKANGEESKHILSVPSQAETKNVGRANEVLPCEQAILEITADLAKKRDKGYRLASEKGAAIRHIPMTAHKFIDHKKKIKYPAYAQPKLDGTRMLYDNESGWSRGNKDYIEECIAHFKNTNPMNIELDGELMLNQDTFTFQETISAIKRFQVGLSDQLEYHVYDLINLNDSNQPFKDRYRLLTQYVSEVQSEGITNIKLVETTVVNNEYEFQAAHDHWVSLGYEGAMIRNMDGQYKINHRSYDLQKYKAFFDSEYTIIGAKDGTGRDAGCVTWICLDEPSGETFDCTPKGTLEMKSDWWNNRESYYGKKLTVRYPNLTDRGIPRFPVGVAIRDYE